MGGAFSFARGAAARGDPAAAPFFLRPGALRPLGGAPVAQAGFPCHGRASFFPLRSCARVAEDGVCYLLYVAFLDTTELIVLFRHSRASCGHCRAFTVETLLRSPSVSFREVQ